MPRPSIVGTLIVVSGSLIRKYALWMKASVPTWFAFNDAVTMWAYRLMRGGNCITAA